MKEVFSSAADQRNPLQRRRLLLGALGGAAGVGVLAKASAPSWFFHANTVNAPKVWPTDVSPNVIGLTVNVAETKHRIDRRVFGTNIEWFNDAGGLAHDALAPRIRDLAREQGVSVLRFPGGTLSDFYHWKDGTGHRSNRPIRKHPTDSGQSLNSFGSPEFFALLRATQSQGLITVNAGTGTASEAASWVDYCNSPSNSQRRADGYADPIGVKLWEVGNELYLPGNPGEQMIGTTPDVYARRYVEFSDSMRAVDSSISVIGIGVAPRSHIGPDSAYPEWSEVLLQRAAPRLDMLAVHNAYFPMLYNVKEPAVEAVYPALWASPDAVATSLDQLGTLIAKYEGSRHISIAVTEWGALFSLPTADPYWTDHVKTQGSAVYVARLLQVLLSNPRVALTNYFKLCDRSFMGWIDYEGNPKVPYHALRLFAQLSGTHVIETYLSNVPTYDCDQIGIMAARRNVPEVTAFASRDQSSGSLFINLINRSIKTIHQVRIDLRGMTAKPRGMLHMLTASEPTAHNGRDIPPEWPYQTAYEPYTTSAPNSISIKSFACDADALVSLPPFSVATLVLDDVRA